MTRAQKLLNASVDIRMNPAESKDAAFLTRQLVQVTLPHSDPGDVPAWSRTNGNTSLTIRSGWNEVTKQEIGYPYGTIPRLLLFWLTTEALRTGSRKVKLGNSLSDFMRELGLIPTGGRRGSITSLRDQMERLFASSFSMVARQDVGNNRGQRWLDMKIASNGELWWNLKNPEQPALFGSWIELGENFYNAITSAPVPLDVRALNALKSSSLALDIYAWATYKAFSLQKTNQISQSVRWEEFLAHLGAEYSNPKDFKKECKKALAKVQAVYPALHIEYVKGGFLIHGGEPAIPHKPTKIIHKSVENPSG